MSICTVSRRHATIEELVMSRTDRFKGLISVYSGIGSLLLAILGFVPTPVANTLNAPPYVGYQLTFLSLLLVGVVLGVYYMTSVIQDEAEKTREAIHEGEFLDMIEETQTEEEKEEQVATDGGGSPTPSKNLSNEKVDTKVDDQKEEKDISAVLERFSVEPTGKGALAGIVIGGVLGLSFGTPGIFVGGFLGGILGNEIEYQIIKQRRQSLFGFNINAGNVGSLSIDLVYDILKNPYRRYTLRVLAEVDGEIGLDTVCERVIDLEQTERDPRSEQGSHRRRIQADLYRDHLPKLDAAGLVYFDKESKIVRKTSKFNDILPYISQDGRFDDVYNKDILYDLLKNRRRRFALQVLMEEGNRMQLSELAEQVGAMENGIPIEELSAAERKRVYTALYQSHLPKMGDAGIIEYNPNRGIVELRDDFDGFEPIRVPESDFRFTWPLYYAMVSLLATVIYLGYGFGLSAFVQFDIKLWFAIYIIVVGTGSMYQIINQNMSD